jgi:hypothetical protein
MLPQIPDELETIRLQETKRYSRRLYRKEAISTMHAVAASFEFRCLERERALIARYGEILTLADIATVLRYPSLQAVQKARIRGKLPVPMTRMAQRCQWFVSARKVAEVLTRLDEQGCSEEGAPMS